VLGFEICFKKADQGKLQGKSEDRSAELVHASTYLQVKKLNFSVVFIEAQTEHNPAGQRVVNYVFPFWIS